MNALQIVAPWETKIAHLPEPDTSQGDVLVRPAFVGVCGTDLELIDGSMPYLAMGLARYPVVLGHEFTGVVIDPGGSTLAKGTHVVADPVIGCGHCEACQSGPATHCQERQEIGVRLGRNGALAQAVSVPGGNLYEIPDGVSLRDAVLVEPSVTGIAAVNRLRAANADRDVLVVGDGTIGLVVAQVLIAEGSSVTVVQRSPTRAALVDGIGAAPILVSDLSAGNGSRFSGAIEASGTTQGIAAAIKAVRPGGSVALVGVYKEMSPVDWTDLVLREVTISGILNGPGLYARALELIAKGVIKPSELIERAYPILEAQDAFRHAARRGRPRPKVLVELSEWEQ